MASELAFELVYTPSREQPKVRYVRRGVERRKNAPQPRDELGGQAPRVIVGVQALETLVTKADDQECSL